MDEERRVKVKERKNNISIKYFFKTHARIFKNFITNYIIRFIKMNVKYWYTYAFDILHLL